MLAELCVLAELAVLDELSILAELSVLVELFVLELDEPLVTVELDMLAKLVVLAELSTAIDCSDELHPVQNTTTASTAPSNFDLNFICCKFSVFSESVVF